MNGLKDATTDEATIRKWWGMWPEANVGISCGPSGLVVVDVDPRHGGDESVRDLIVKHGNGWTETPSSLTGGGGQHYLFRATKPVRNAAGIFPGIDIRGQGGYIVAPPSLHESGKRYEWEQTAAEVELLEFPREIFPSRRRESTSAIGAVIPMGQRDQTLTSVAGTMRRRGLSEAAILAALREENAIRCDPPLPDGDLIRIARSVGRYEPADEHLLKVRSGAPMYSALRKNLTRPPSYVLRVGETDVRVSSAILNSHARLRVAIHEQADMVVPRMKPIEWDNQLAALTADMQRVEAPEDASEHGIVWASLLRFLQVRTEDETRFAQGRALESGDNIYVTGAMLRGALRSYGINIEQRELWDTIRGHGGDSKTVRIDGRVQRVWAIPLSEMPAEGS